MSKQTPWAVLKIKFRDHQEPSPIPEETYEKLFTTAGDGTFNMVRYFDDMSHGNVDLTGSKVFGWFTIDHDLSELQSGSLSRVDLPDLARNAAIAAGVDLSAYTGVVITFNVAIGGAYAYGGAAVGDYRYVGANGSQAFGQEMGHVYGLNHSRRDGSTDDYKDPWDGMSTAAAYHAVDPDFGARGPGMNAANMRALGWLDPTRVWRASAPAFSEVVQLRPLHRRDLPGALAIELPPFSYGPVPAGPLVEFRLRDRWDAGFHRSAVLVHQLRSHYSYVFSGTSGNADLVVGDAWSAGVSNTPLTPHTVVEVLAIDEQGESATVRVRHQPARRPWLDRVRRLLGAITMDGAGVIIRPGGVVPVPPWNPMARVLDLLADVEATESVAEPRLRRAARRHALESLSSAVADEIAALDAFGAPQPAPNASTRPKAH